MPAISLYDYLLQNHPHTLRMILDDLGKIAIVVLDDKQRVVTYNKQFRLLSDEGKLEQNEVYLNDLMQPVDSSSPFLLPPKGSYWKVNVIFNSGQENADDIGYEAYIFSDKDEYIICFDDLVSTDALASAKMARLNEELTDLMRELQKKNRELEQAKATIQHVAMHDFLTELLNRRACQTELEKVIAAANRHGFPTALAMMDIDHFKKINDEFGHETGDDVLKEFGQMLLDSCRKEDIAGRWGGEEFILLMPYTNTEAGKQVCERIRTLFQQAVFPGIDRPITVSIGLTTLRPGDSLDSLAARADEALYKA
ncbi:MAG: GGDEF domain-containing protein, partial [Verrucomicrobiota bacterium]